MSQLQHSREILGSKAAERTRKRIFKSTLSGQDVDEHNIRKRVLGLLQSDDATRIMAGFDLLQCCRSNCETDGPKKWIKWELLKMHASQAFAGEEDDKTVLSAIDKLSVNVAMLSTILVRGHVSFWMGDYQFTGLTKSGKYVLQVLSGRVNEVNDATALAYIACYSSNEADRSAAVDRLNDPAALQYVVLNSATQISLRALEKLPRDAIIKVAIALGNPRHWRNPPVWMESDWRTITEEGNAVLGMLAGDRKALEEVATYARGKHGELAASMLKDDFTILQRVASRTPWVGQPISPVTGEPNRRRFVLRILEPAVDTVTDRNVLKVVAQHSDDERARELALQRLSETSLLGRLKRLVASS